jgi:cytochrome c biogenesis protein CcmG/thiol:disulfide interchange protein DsbE
LNAARKQGRWSGAVLALLLPLSAAEAAEPGQPMIGEPAPAFQLDGVNGETLSLADLRGRFIVLHFGASW